MEEFQHANVIMWSVLDEVLDMRWLWLLVLSLIAVGPFITAGHSAGALPMLYSVDCWMDLCGKGEVLSVTAQSGDEAAGTFQVQTRWTYTDHTTRLTDNTVVCEPDFDRSVYYYAKGQLITRPVNLNDKSPSQADRDDYALWWAVCRHQPLKFDGGSKFDPAQVDKRLSSLLDGAGDKERTAAPSQAPTTAAEPPPAEATAKDSWTKFRGISLFMSQAELAPALRQLGLSIKKAANYFNFAPQIALLKNGRMVGKLDVDANGRLSKLGLFSEFFGAANLTAEDFARAIMAHYAVSEFELTDCPNSQTLGETLDVLPRCWRGKTRLGEWVTLIDIPRIGSSILVEPPRSTDEPTFD